MRADGEFHQDADDICATDDAVFDFSFAVEGERQAGRQFKERQVLAQRISLENVVYQGGMGLIHDIEPRA